MLIDLPRFVRIASRLTAATVLAVSIAGRCTAQTIPIVTGTERLQWDQTAANLNELDTLRYALFVDGARIELADTSCTDTASTAGFTCDGALPPLSAGQHTLQLSAFVSGQTDLESPRSAPLVVSVASTIPPEQPISVVTGDGVALQVDTIIRTKDSVNGLATTADGALIVAERGGALTIRRNGVTIRDAAPLPDVTPDAGGLLAVAPDPDFSRSHFVYVAYTARTGETDRVVRLARLRETSGTFGDRIVVFENPLTGPVRTAALRVAVDGTLYFGVNDTIVRLNADGTTPSGQAGMTPTIASGFTSVSGLDWQPGSGSLWVTDGSTSGSGQLARILTNGTANASAAAVKLPALPSAMTFYNRDVIAMFQGDAFVASDDGQTLLRIRFNVNDPTMVSAIEPLLAQQIGGIRSVATGTDGTLLLGTAQAVLRLAITSR